MQERALRKHRFGKRKAREAARCPLLYAADSTWHVVRAVLRQRGLGTPRLSDPADQRGGALRRRRLTPDHGRAPRLRCHPLEVRCQVVGADDAYMKHVSGVGAETKLWTEEGLLPVGKLVGRSFRLMQHRVGGTVFQDATLESLGTQPAVAVTIGRKSTKTIVTGHAQEWRVKTRTADHRLDSSIVPSANLIPGQRLVTVRPRSRLGKVTPSPFGVAAGIVFGDGYREPGRDSTAITLHGSKRQLVDFFRGCRMTVTPDGSINVWALPRSFKDPIALNEGTSALYGWLAGYIATDGSVSGSTGQVSLCSARWEHLDFVRTVCTRLGIGCGDISAYSRIGLGQSEPTNVFTIRLQHPPAGLLLRGDHRRNWQTPKNAVPSWTVREVQPVPPTPQWALRTAEGASPVLDGYVLLSSSR
jgi:hypothetical protein